MEPDPPEEQTADPVRVYKLHGEPCLIDPDTDPDL